jgi:gamma-glutamyl-gamma-aminobutyrate hydrolase PuuD
MRIPLSLATLLLFAAVQAAAGDMPVPTPSPTPEPPAPCNGMGPGVTLRIACTGYCADSQVAAIRKVAEEMKVRVDFLVLMDKSGQASVDLENPEKSFDAIISPGGWDTLPGYFGALGPDNPEKKELRAHMEDLFCTQKLGKTGEFTQKRDHFEFDFDAGIYLRNSRYRNIPYLATCYGMQLMGAALGMPEYVDIEWDLHIPNRKKKSDTDPNVSDSVTITDRSSTIGKIFPKGGFTAVESHHQALHLDYYNRHKKDFPALKVTGTSNDGKILESFEIVNRNFIGTQFHPENSNDDVKLPMYRWFLQNACVQAKRAGRRFSIANLLAKLHPVPGAPKGALPDSKEGAVMGCPLTEVPAANSSLTGSTMSKP